MTEIWKQLTYADIREILAEDEIEKLDSLSIEVEDVCQKILDSVADQFRGIFQTKGWQIDERPHRIPNCYKVFVLNIARIQIWSRFPNSKDIAIDDVRDKLYDDAKKMLENPTVGVPEPDYSDDPSYTPSQTQGDASLSLPYSRLNTYQDNGFYFNTAKNAYLNSKW